MHEKQRFTILSGDVIKLFQTKINRRARKLLVFEMPKDLFYRKVALAA
jgi:IS30 family transposase